MKDAGNLQPARPRRGTHSEDRLTLDLFFDAQQQRIRRTLTACEYRVRARLPSEGEVADDASDDTPDAA